MGFGGAEVTALTFAWSVMENNNTACFNGLYWYFLASLSAPTNPPVLKFLDLDSSSLSGQYQLDTCDTLDSQYQYLCEGKKLFFFFLNTGHTSLFNETIEYFLYDATTVNRYISVVKMSQN